ncbi:MAG: hypothetical protein IJB68_02240 [Ruminococcus sp.]|nr:hypothetical protein [Ruminococcus sp.]
MKKTIKSIAALVTALSVTAGIVPVSSFAYETGTIDMSDITLEFGTMKSMSLEMQSMPRILADDEIEDYLLGAHLDANNRAVYDAFLELTEPSLEEFTVKLPETVSFKTMDIESDENMDFYNAVFTNCASGMEASSFDTPWIFWLDQNFTSVSASNMRYTRNIFTKEYTFYIEELTFSPAMYESFESFEQVLEYKAKLEETVENYVIEGETTEEKLKSIHDSICYFTDYDTGGKFSGSVISSLVEPGAVCEGYAKGFKLLADKIGVPTVCVFGNFEEDTASAHMWNYVQMDDGYWYAVDVTWDDYDGEYGLEIIYDYFLKGSEDFNVKHTEFTDYNLTHLEFPEIAEWNYGENIPDVKVTTMPVTTTTTKPTTTTTKPTTTTTKPTTTTTKPTTTTTKPTTTTTKPTTTTTKPTTTTTKPTTTTTKPTTTTTKPTTTTTKPTTTTTKKPTTTTTKPTTTTTKPTTTITKPVTTTTPQPVYEEGDLNRDGKVSIADLVCCAEAAMGIAVFDFSCDVNKDGRTDVFDVIIMRQLVVEKVRSTFGLR